MKINVRRVFAPKIGEISGGLKKNYIMWSFIIYSSPNIKRIKLRRHVQGMYHAWGH
jgi:hypothetical protein